MEASCVLFGRMVERVNSWRAGSSLVSTKAVDSSDVEKFDSSLGATKAFRPTNTAKVGPNLETNLPDQVRVRIG